MGVNAGQICLKCLFLNYLIERDVRRIAAMQRQIPYIRYSTKWLILPHPALRHGALSNSSQSRNTRTALRRIAPSERTR